MVTTGSPKRDGEDGNRATDPPAGDGRVTRRHYLSALGAVATACLAGCSGVFGQRNTNETTTTSAPTAGTATPGGRATDTTGATGNATGRQNATGGESAYTQVYRDTIDSVVLIDVTTPRGAAEGTGFVYDDSHLVTNAHVVSDANSVELRFSNEKYLDASVVGTDVSSDLAALETKIPSTVDALSIHPAQPAIGTEVLAIGNPYGNYGTASEGIVSAVNRSIPAQNGYTIPDAIQTDAAVNPGNSGGPLMNLDGEVLGVVNSGRRGSQNIAFAISAALVHRVIPALIKNGTYNHSYLGVRLGPVTPDVAKRAGLDRSRGVVVERVRRNGPSAGTLRQGDVVVRLGNQRVDSLQDLSSYLALQTSPNDTLHVTVVRNGSKKPLTLTLGTRPQNPNIGVAATTGR